MVGYDSRHVVAELLCNRSLANVPHCGYKLGLKWNLDPADLTENVSPGGRGGGGWFKLGKKKYTVFVNKEMEIVFFFGFIFFILFYVYIGRWSSRTLDPDCWSSCNMCGKMRAGEVDDDRGMVNNVDVCREMLSYMRDRISVCVVMVVLMGVVGVVCLEQWRWTV